MRDINLIVIHCTASPNGRPVSVDTIREWHKARGFKDVGYHYVIGIDGSANMARPEEDIGAHALGYNAHSIGVCMVGGTGGGDPLNPGRYTMDQWHTLRILVSNLLARFPKSIVRGHRELSPDLNHNGTIEPSEWIKLCPSFNVEEWLEAGMVPPSEQVLEGK